jgi:heat shock protein HslJ
LEEYRLNMEDDQLAKPIQGIDLNLIFDDQSRFSGFAGCNTFSGRYVTDGSDIIFKDFLVTQQACEQPEGIGDQETQYLQWLERAEAYRIDPQGSLELIIYVIENNQRVEKIILRFYDLRLGPPR